MIREYDVSYIAKEYLRRNGWIIIAYNPPGSQGTFTITNPKKDSGYRGQTGSLSPDIICFKEIDGINTFGIVEAKPKANINDINKMRSLFKDKMRMEIFIRIIKGYALANGINIDFSLGINVIYFKAHGDKADLLSSDIKTIYVNQINDKWNPENINPKEDIYKYFDVKVI